jgi:hypothetical protein
MMIESERKNEQRTWFFNELSRPESQHGSPNDAENEKSTKSKQAKSKKEAKTKRGCSPVWLPILLLDKSVSVDTN